MDLGLAFTGGGVAMGDLVSLGRAAEENHFDAVYLTEAWRSAFVPLAALATATERIRIGSYVLNAYGRSPFVAAMAAVDLDELSGGRLVLGVGGGNKIINEQWQGTPHARVLTKMEEYVTLLRRAARTRIGEPLDFDGEVHSMHWVPAVDPIRAFPVILAAIFPRMVRVAGRCADGLACGGVISAEYIRDVIRPNAREAAEAADRDPDALSFLTAGLVSIDPDREVARRYARESICALFDPLPHPYYEFTLREQGFSAVADAALKHMPAGELEQAVDAIPDECIDSVAIAGTADECLTRLATYRGVVDEVVCLNMTPPPGGDVEAAYAPIFELASAFRTA